MNCAAKGLDAKHWDFDATCPSRKQKQTSKASKVKNSWALAASDTSKKDIQQLKVRVQKLGTRVDANDRKHAAARDAIRTTRLATLDIALVTTGKKKAFGPKTDALLSQWWTQETAIAKSLLPGRNKEEESKSSGSRNQPAPKRKRDSFLAASAVNNGVDIFDGAMEEDGNEDNEVDDFDVPIAAAYANAN